jgi:cell division protein FtsW (lipid II flippase)
MTGLKTEGSRNPEIESARSMYTWLKISPIFTVPTILFLFQRDLGYDLICGTDWITNFSNCNTDMADFVSIALAIMLPALWHVLLLIQVRNQKREFARWHGWQALMLAGIRTAISLVFVLVDGWTRMNDAMNGTWRSGFGSYPLAVILLMIAYFAGNSKTGA